MTLSPEALRIIQSGGIVVSIGIGVYSVWIGAQNSRAASRAAQVRNLLDITQSHRDIWRRYQEQPGLERVMEFDVDATTMTDAEFFFLRELILHVSASFEANRVGVLSPLEGMNLDVRSLLARPLPRAAWERLRPVQNAAFRDFIDKALAEADREVVQEG
jgi:hypothetical protein